MLKAVSAPSSTEQSSKQARIAQNIRPPRPCIRSSSSVESLRARGRDMSSRSERELLVAALVFFRLAREPRGGTIADSPISSPDEIAVTIEEVFLA